VPGEPGLGAGLRSDSGGPAAGRCAGSRQAVPRPRLGAQVPARGDRARDDPVSAAGGAVLSQALVRAAQPATPRESSGIDVGRTWPGGWRPQGMAAPAGQENDHPCDSQACWTFRRPNAPAYTSLPVALSRSLST